MGKVIYFFFPCLCFHLLPLKHTLNCEKEGSHLKKDSDGNRACDWSQLSMQLHSQRDSCVDEGGEFSVVRL